MSAIAQILSEIERRGIVVRLDGENLRLAPRRALDPELLKDISDHKTEIMREAARRGGVHLRSGWPPESLGSERRFCQPHAKLFPFIGYKVRTPQGPGTLLQAFAERVTVVLDTERSKCAIFLPTEVEPASKDDF
ncbi:MAG TPA: hypothetical protein VMU57_02900 [Edaphobacter sp.]|uniref:TubC N-terminal docking domain-related protein n=1 Tax=Edaphobacter sp. TaxID=1934404 RepID=UPI002BB100CB|nr:hypothetical protein [Edaphobacter sp.]HUZ93839.1 hypothetical protein [Edaphobacter sp.]